MTSNQPIVFIVKVLKLLKFGLFELRSVSLVVASRLASEPRVIGSSRIA